MEALIVATQMAEVTTINMIKPSKVEREGLRTTMQAETSNANIVTKLTCPIPHFTLIWSKNIPRAQMVNWETLRPVEEEEVDQERTLIRDKIQGLKTSSRPLREMVAQLTLFAASRKSTLSSSSSHILIPPSILPKQDHSSRACTTIQFTST